MALLGAKCLQELPPRARRIHLHAVRTTGFDGTTSACAENTVARTGIYGHSRNYLRVRGEYGIREKTRKPVEELPPRARRIPSGE